MADTTTLVEDLVFPECPRWHDGSLWFSDQHEGRVVRLDVGTGRVDTVVEVPGDPSGLGWLPDGRMLVVSMQERRVLRLEDDGLHEHADLSRVAGFHCNDMVVDRAGRAYVGNFGYDLGGREEPRTATLALVHPDGTVQAAATDLMFPNGTVISDDGATLTIGETTAARITTFTVAADGTLHDRRTFATFTDAVPDGICLDAEGAIWVASPIGHQVLRVRDGGDVVARVDLGDRNAYACMLGGADLRTLFICTAPTFLPERAREARAGRIEAVRVDVPGAGLP